MLTFLICKIQIGVQTLVVFFEVEVKNIHYIAVKIMMRGGATHLCIMKFQSSFTHYSCAFMKKKQ